MSTATFSMSKNAGSGWATGATLTAADLNAEFQNILNNLNCSGIGSESTGTSEMQATSDPYAGGTATAATALQGDIQQLRYLIAQITGETYWYIDPDITLANIALCCSTAGKGTILDETPADDSYHGITAQMTAGENVVLGEILYLKSDGKLWKAKADSTTTMPVFGCCVDSTIAADGAGTILLKGFINDTSAYNWSTVGAKLYAATSVAGDFVDTRPTSGTIQSLGWVTHADRLYFEPGYDEVSGGSVRMEVGKYSGDGATSGTTVSLTNTAMDIQFLSIWVDTSTTGTFQYPVTKIDDSNWGNVAYRSNVTVDDRLTTLGTGSFVVMYSGSSQEDVNVNGQSYSYLAIGTV